MVNLQPLAFLSMVGSWKLGSFSLFPFQSTMTLCFTNSFMYENTIMLKILEEQNCHIL